MITFLDFEKPIAELEAKIRELRQLAGGTGSVNISDDVGRLEGKLDKMLRETYQKLSPAQKMQVARHPERPQSPERGGELPAVDAERSVHAIDSEPAERAVHDERGERVRHGIPDEAVELRVS